MFSKCSRYCTENNFELFYLEEYGPDEPEGSQEGKSPLSMSGLKQREVLTLKTCSDRLRKTQQGSLIFTHAKNAGN